MFESRQPYVRGPAPERFWPKVDKDGPVPEHRPDLGPCWVWVAGGWKRGYGCFYHDNRMTRAHCFAYELLVGPVPDGLELDHLCRNKGCVNPTHLEPVTHDENIKRHFRSVAI